MPQCASFAEGVTSRLSGFQALPSVMHREKLLCNFPTNVQRAGELCGVTGYFGSLQHICVFCCCCAQRCPKKSIQFFATIARTLTPPLRSVTSLQQNATQSFASGVFVVFLRKATDAIRLSFPRLSPHQLWNVGHISLRRVTPHLGNCNKTFIFSCCVACYWENCTV